MRKINKDSGQTPWTVAPELAMAVDQSEAVDDFDLVFKPEAVVDQKLWFRNYRMNKPSRASLIRDPFRVPLCAL